MKPFSQSCEENKNVILEIIKPLLSSCHSVLEIGSGTGQHAIYFAQAMSHLQWFTSDRKEALEGIQMWLDEFGLKNINSPILLDVKQTSWPDLKVDAVFSANTLHIMSWQEVELFFQQAPLLLSANGKMLVYGPFNYQGNYTSDSNQRFDGWLKARDPASGIRDFEKLNELAEQSGLGLQNDFAMPANNRILCWQKQ